MTRVFPNGPSRNWQTQLLSTRVYSVDGKVLMHEGSEGVSIEVYKDNFGNEVMFEQAQTTYTLLSTPSVAS